MAEANTPLPKKKRAKKRRQTRVDTARITLIRRYESDPDRCVRALTSFLLNDPNRPH